MSDQLKEEEAQCLEFDESLFDSSNDIDDRIKKSKTLMSEDSGIGIGTAVSPDDENPYLLSGTCFKMTRSTGIHSGLSEHIKTERGNKSPVNKFTSAFGQYLALAKRLRDSSLDSSNASSDEDCFVEENDSIEEDNNNKDGVIPDVVENKENMNQKATDESNIFHRGLKCDDVESALKILKTRYLLTDVNLKQHGKRIAAPSMYPVSTPKFIDTSVWKTPASETPATKTLREVKEEIELRNKEIEGIARMILKRHQDVINEENKLMEAKRARQEFSEPAKVYPPTPAKTSVELVKKSKKSKNPFGRAFQSMKKFVRRGRMARA